MRAPVVAVVFLASSVAAAQPAIVEPSPDYKDPATALGLSIGATAVGLGGMLLGYEMVPGGETPVILLGGLVTIVGPVAGDWWVNDRAAITTGFAIRLAGAGVAGLGLARAYDEKCDVGKCDSETDTLIGVGAAVVALGIIWDIAALDGTTREHNAKITVAPQVLATPSGPAAGLGVSGRF